MKNLLEGIRVLDFGRYIAGPYAAMVLSDFGADVIRIERRSGGEDRYTGPVTDSGEGGLFLNLNRNKRGITLDPAHAGAAPILEQLVRSADVVIVNLPIDVMQRLGLDYDSLRAVKPDIILAMASAFGPDGPYRQRLGFDGIVQAMSGMMALSGHPDAPIRSIVPWVDYGTALHAAFGVMAALYHRAQTGEGQLIDVSLLATGVMFMTPLLAERAATDKRRVGQGNTGYWSAPSDAYRTRDGWIMVPTVGGPMFRRWARLMQREDLIDDPRCADDTIRGDNQEMINEVMSAWTAQRTTAEAMAALEEVRIPCGPVQTLDDVLADPQVQARQLLEEIPWPESRKPVPLSGPAVRLSGTPGRIAERAPTLGEHTDAVLGELGFSGDQIAQFRRDEVI